VGEEIDERAGGRFYGIAVGIDSVRLDGSQVPGGKNADLAIKWRYRDPTRRITLDLPRSKTGKPASSTICCRPCTARATRCYSRGDVAHEPDLRSRHSGWAPLSRTRQCERQPLGGPKSLVWVKGGKTLSEYMFSGLLLIADVVRSAFHYFVEPTRTADHAFWVRAIPCSGAARQRHNIIRNRVALLSEESVSGVTAATAVGSTRRTHPCASTSLAMTESH
jgi:hypothetical protein